MEVTSITSQPLDARRRLALLRLTGQAALGEYRDALRRSSPSEAHTWSAEVDRVCDQLQALEHELFGVERRGTDAASAADEFFVYDDDGTERFDAIGWGVVAGIITFIVFAFLAIVIYRSAR